MASDEGFLDDGSGRDTLIGRLGHDDSSLHAGDWLEVWIETQWVAFHVEADLDGRWYFLDALGMRVQVRLGMKARLLRSWLAM